jgi:RNA polymerase sigma-70 factor (ECF subfamily)
MTSRAHLTPAAKPPQSNAEPAQPGHDPGGCSSAARRAPSSGAGRPSDASVRTAPPRTAAQRRARDADVLVETARQGDPDAFDALVRRFRPRIYALALHLTGSASDADDIAQEAFVEAYRHIAHFEGRSQFFTWLYRITVNRALNTQRQRARGAAVPLEDARVEAAMAVDAPSDPRLALSLRETYAQLVRALDGLSAGLKSAVVLTALSGLSYEEAAVVLGTTPGAVAVRIHEARKQLRTALTAGERRRGVTALESEKQTSSSYLELAMSLASVL